MRGVVLMFREWWGCRGGGGVVVGRSRGRLRAVCRRWRGRGSIVLRIRERESEGS